MKVEVAWSKVTCQGLNLTLEWIALLFRYEQGLKRYMVILRGWMEAASL
jgi:hypothetical protein